MENITQDRKNNKNGTEEPKTKVQKIDTSLKEDKMADKNEETEKSKFNSLTADDWVKRWENRNIGFHKTNVHPLLEKHIDVLINGREKVKIFYPLCGKAVDMKWFLDYLTEYCSFICESLKMGGDYVIAQHFLCEMARLADMGHTVVGVDVSEMAFKEFFEEQNLEYSVEDIKSASVKGKIYKNNDNSIRLYKCDYYEFNKELEGEFGAIWDRGSLVAINREDREKYAKVLQPLMAPDCQYLVDIFDYDESKYGGPPQFVPEEQLISLFSDKCNLKKIDRVDSLEDKHRGWGLDYFYENIFIITLKDKDEETAKPKFNSLKADDWVKSWENRDIGFHRTNVHPLLEKHIDVLINGREKVKIFYPLCGKAVDMKWLADMGHTVVGVDVSEMAFKEFFEEQNLEYSVEDIESASVKGKIYKNNDNSIRLYNCDLYEFNKELEGEFGAIWDRGSLVAINREDRGKYAKVLQPLMAPDCQYLVEIFDYDENKYGGPPHFVPEEQLISLFSDKCNLKQIDRVESLEEVPKTWGLDYLYVKIYVITLKDK